jgi:3,4-dihydroxy 2-butanone 4-phosphate synthase/GTP cyclohydrolase II
MNPDGTMARMPDLELFSKIHGVRMATIADLIRYRLLTERLVRRCSEACVVLEQTGTEWLAIVYESLVTSQQYLALVKGDLLDGPAPLCRVHAGSIWDDVFGSPVHDGGRHLREAIDCIEREGRGALVYVVPGGDLRRDLDACISAGQRRTDGASSEQSPLRDIGLGAQVLADLGVRELRLLTSHPRRIAGIEGFGLHVVERVSLAGARNAAE